MAERQPLGYAGRSHDTSAPLVSATSVAWIGTRLLGVFFLLSGAVGLLFQVGLTAMAAFEFGVDNLELNWLLVQCLNDILQVAAGVALIVLAASIVKWVGDGSVTDASTSAAIATAGAALIGVYFAVTGGTGAVYSVFSLIYEGDWEWYAVLGSQPAGVSGVVFGVARLLGGLAVIGFAKRIGRATV
ncbi:MAG: hypothetical protein AAF656_06715 [Planctomycetota bacterium]